MAGVGAQAGVAKKARATENRGKSSSVFTQYTATRREAPWLSHENGRHSSRASFAWGQGALFRAKIRPRISKSRARPVLGFCGGSFLRGCSSLATRGRRQCPVRFTHRAKRKKWQSP